MALNDDSYYGTLAGAESYFEGSLHSDPWDRASLVEKRKALTTSTRQIDRLNFQGCKAVVTQPFQFPRNVQPNQVVPQDIEYATYELASCFLDGVDAELEFQNLGLKSQKFSGVDTRYDTTVPNLHIISGIPSRAAWNYLKPYLRDDQQIVLVRS